MARRDGDGDGDGDGERTDVPARRRVDPQRTSPNSTLIGALSISIIH
jgi:hypothetical protein